MDSKEIKVLVDRYFAGETTLEEEQQLRDYFQDGKQLEPTLKGIQPLFQWAKAERARVAPTTVKRPTLYRKLPLYARIASVAALFLLAVMVTWRFSEFVNPEPQTAQINWEQYEVESPEEAAVILTAALQKAGITLQAGAEQALRELESVERLSDPIE